MFLLESPINMGSRVGIMAQVSTWDEVNHLAEFSVFFFDNSSRAKGTTHAQPLKDAIGVLNIC
jgi:hypothetical protein